MACEAIQGNGRVCGRMNCRIHDRGDTNETCAICLDEFGLGFVKRLRCNHVFHKRCIRRWQENSCPTCRAEIRPEPRFRVVTTVQVYEGDGIIETHTHQSEHFPVIALEFLMENMEDVDFFIRNEILATE